MNFACTTLSSLKVNGAVHLLSKESLLFYCIFSSESLYERSVKQLFFKNTFLTLYCDKELQLGEAIWSGELYGDEYREACLLCLDLIDRFQLTRWLGNNRKMKTISSADMNWSVEVFLPQLLGGPLLRLANLPSVHEENRKAIEVMMDKMNLPGQKLIIRDFQNEQEALNWLLE